MADEKSWWEVASIVGSALATIIVAIFAAVQLWRERRAAVVRRAAAEARISAGMYLMRRQLRAWLGENPESEDKFEKWIRSAQNANTLERETGLAERRLIRAVAQSGDASERIAKSLSEALVYFLAGADRLAEFVALGSATANDVWDWMQLRKDAANHFRDCLASVEPVISPLLINVEHIAERRRKEEDVIEQFAEALQEQIHDES